MLSDIKPQTGKTVSTIDSTCCGLQIFINIYTFMGFCTALEAGLSPPWAQLDWSQVFDLVAFAWEPKLFNTRI